MSSQDGSGETYVIEDVCNYVSTKSNPAGADKIRKRIIRWKAQRLAVKDGELGIIYKKIRSPSYIASNAYIIIHYQ